MKKIILCIMMAVLVTPTLAALFGWGKSFTINENRNRIEYPNMETFKTRGFECINEWYNDNFDLRDLLIRLQHQIDYTFFGYSKELFFSTNKGQKYLFYRNVVAIEQRNNEIISEERQENILRNLQQVKELLTSQGIALKFMIAPQKNEILPESIQEMPVIRNEKNMYYVMQEKYTEAGLGDVYVNVIDELKRRNEQTPVYYYSDFHWNDWGAAVAFGEVIQSYSEDLGMETPYNVDELIISSFVPNKNIGQLASLSVLYYDIPAEYTADISSELNAYLVDSEDKRFRAIWENPAEPVFDGAVLFIGDSYTTPALMFRNNTSSGIVDLFGKTYFCHWDDSEGILQDIPTDVKLVVIESIESHYAYLDRKLGSLLNQK